MPDVEPLGVIQKFSTGDGGYAAGRLHEIFFNAQKAAPGLHKGKNRRCKKKFH